MKTANKKGNNVSPFFLMEIENCKIKQIYPRLSMSEEKDLALIWSELNNITNKKDLQSWINKFRLFIWNNECEWERIPDKENIKYYQDRVERLMGNNLFCLISKDIVLKNNYEYEDIIDLELIIEDRENKFKIRKAFFNEDIVYPKDLNYENILLLSEKIGKKYGLKNILISDNLCFEDIYSYLINIDNNFNIFINALQLNSEKIGLNKLVLNIELENVDNNKFNHINIGINNTHCFSYDWIRFIDNLASYKIEDNNLNKDKNYFFSEIILGALLDKEDKYYSLKKSMNEKYKISNLSSSVIVMKKMLHAFPDIIFYMKKHAHHEKEVDALNKIAIVIDKYIGVYENQTHTFLESKKSWQNCKKTCENILIQTNANKNSHLFKLWLYVVSLTERISFNEKVFPAYKLWFILSVFISRIENNTNLALRNEILARGFTSVIRYRVKKDTWLANNTGDILFYPKNEELLLEDLWWRNNLIEIINMLD